MAGLRSLFISFILFVTLVSFTSAQSFNSAGLEDANNKIADSYEKLDDIKYDHLQKSWRDLLANNKFIKPINEFFMKIDPFFQIVFGESFDLTLSFFFVFLLWITIFLFIYFSSLSIGFASEHLVARIGIAVLIPIMLAQMTFFSTLSLALIKLIFYSENTFWRIATFFVVLVLFGVYFYLGKFLGAYFKKQRRKAREAKNALDVKEVKAYTDTMRKFSK